MTIHSMDADSILASLNQQQRSAVTAPQGHWLVLAGAGCGKTRVLVHRIAWHIYTGQAQAHGILAVTFTNKAATEMRERITQLLQKPSGGMWVGTFHSLAHKTLRIHWEEAGLPSDFRILDSDDQRRTVRQIIQELNLDEQRWEPRRAQGFINARKEEGLRAAHLTESMQIPEPLIQVYRSYQEKCDRNGLVDFTELLLRTYELLRTHPELLAHYRQRFQYLLVDEFQDTNALQYAWIHQMSNPDPSASDSPPGGRVFAVGDDDQSIYGWRGAQVENMLKFSKDFPGSQLLRLEKNYRSSGNILHAANHLIERNGGRLGKQLWTDQGEGDPIEVYTAYNERDEANYLAMEIQRAQEQYGGYSEIAVLYRTSAQSRAIEEALIQAGIPHRVYGGLRFYERQEIKDALAYLRLAVSPGDDPSFGRIVNVPPRGLGRQTLENLRDLAHKRQESLWQTLEVAIEHELLPGRAVKGLQSFHELMCCITKSVKDVPLEEAVKAVLMYSRLVEHYKSKESREQARSREENLQELVDAAIAFEENREDHEMDPLSAFLAHSALEAGINQAGNQEACVNLMTLHSAKGLEFNKVFITGMEEKLLPHHLSADNPTQLEEERRLCYVGITRARHSLSLSHAEKRRLYGKEKYHSPSRFLQELPEDLLRHLNGQGCSANHFGRPGPGRSSGMTPGVVPGLPKRTDLHIGQQVVHLEFGEGVVIALEEHREGQTRVQINFEHAGKKWLLANQSPLWAAPDPSPLHKSQ